MAYTEKEREYNRQYYINHKAECDARNKLWYANNIERERANRKEYNDSHKEEYAVYREENKDKINLWHKENYMNNRDRKLEYNRAHREESKVAYIKRKYSIGVEEYNNILRGQNFKCAICGSELKLDRKTHVDHNHKTNYVRGILCENCNHGIGGFMDDPRLCIRAANYLWDEVKG